MFAIVNASSIDNHTVYLTKLNMKQFKEVEHGQSVWMIQLVELSGKPTNEFKKAAYLLRGVVKAGFMDECEGHEICKDKKNGVVIGDKYKPGKVVFIHSEDVHDDYINEHNYNITSKTAYDYVMDKFTIQKNDSFKHYDPNNVKILDFFQQN